MNLGPLFTNHLQRSTLRRPKPRLAEGNNQTSPLVLEPPTVPSDPTQHRWRTVPFASVCIIILSLIAGRLWQLQIVEGKEQLTIANQNSTSLEMLTAPRGLIYDRHGVVLARNEPAFRVTATLARLPTNQTALQTELAKLGQLLQVSQTSLQQQLAISRSTPFLSITLKSGLDRDAELLIIANKDQLPGINVEEDIRRSYPLAAITGQILGYASQMTEQDLLNPNYGQYLPGENVGQAGLEQQYELPLHGTAGQKFTQVNAHGQQQSRQVIQPPIPGQNLVLSLDSALQQEAAAVLDKYIQKNHATGGAFVASNPNTGQILSLLSLPSYDDNLFARGINANQYQQLINDPGQPMFNRAIAGTYPPGSTVKPLVAAGAITEGTITPQTIINSPSYISIGSYRYADWTYAYGRSAPGNQTVLQAIANSTDTFFYQVGGGYQNVKGMGVNALDKYFRQAGLGSLTGIDLPGEAKGLVPDPAWKEDNFPDDPGWYIGNTYQLAIGQSYLLATPLQVNIMTAAIANGGNVLVPQLVDHLTDQNNHPLTTFHPKIKSNHLASSQGLEIARQGMRQAVQTGIVYNFRNNPWPTAAKTGTAEFGTKNTLNQYQTHAWVTGFAPFDHPQICFTLLLESGGASTEAADAGNEILTWYEQHQ